MSEEAHAEYFAARELVERDMGSRASDARVAAAHAEMAERYEALALVFGAKRAANAPASQEGSVPLMAWPVRIPAPGS